MSNILSRILTAVVLLPIVLMAFFLGNIYFTLLLTVVSFLSGLEVIKMIEPHKRYAKTTALLFLLWLFFPLIIGPEASSLIFVVPGIFVFNIYILFSPSLDRLKFEKLSTIFYWTFYINFALACIYWLRNTPLLEPEQNLSFILLLCLATWANDTFAYFGGRIFGKHPLYKKVSSNKTWEGFISGGIFSLALVFIFKYLPLWWGLDLLQGLVWSDLLWIAVPVVVAAPFGDLIESRFKRFYEIKDSSKMLPGHGGILDRIDGLLIVAPWTALYVFIIRPLY